jgi:hypothetical protein
MDTFGNWKRTGKMSSAFLNVILNKTVLKVHLMLHIGFSTLPVSIHDFFVVEKLNKHPTCEVKST